MTDIQNNDEKGLVFNIIHGSLVDGHGIRTTMFLKGCPLKCLWCCNPEGQSRLPELKYIEEKCTGCGKCLKVCPVSAISIDQARPGSKVNIDRKLCNACGKCVEACPEGAFEMAGRYYTTDELVKIAQSDEIFYRESDGGITIGGGEPTFQAKFTHDLIKKCKENCIPVALDTCGYTLNSDAYKLLEDADLLLFDLKGMDPELHLKATGVSNERILENIKKLSDLGKPIIVRLPIIPGYTDSEAYIEKVSSFLSTLKSVERVDILPYHEYGIIKYKQLGKDYNFNPGKVSQEKLDSIKAVFEAKGLKVQIGG
jgi:glycyl-radical enzyme activating protein